VYEETLTGRPHDTSVQKATGDNERWMQFNVMPRTWLKCLKVPLFYIPVRWPTGIWSTSDIECLCLTVMRYRYWPPNETAAAWAVSSCNPCDHVNTVWPSSSWSCLQMFRGGEVLPVFLSNPLTMAYSITFFNICSTERKCKITKIWCDNEIRWIRITVWNGGDL